MQRILENPWWVFFLLNNIGLWGYLWLHAYGQRRVRELYLSQVIAKAKHPL